MIETFWQALRHAARSLARSPGFTRLMLGEGSRIIGGGLLLGLPAAAYTDPLVALRQE